MEKKFKIFIGCVVSVILLQVTIGLIWMGTKTKTAYINTEAVYNNFELKKELESDLKKTQEVRQLMLDSLRFRVELLSLELQKPEHQSDSSMIREFTALRESYFSQQQQFDQANTTLAEQYTEEVWSQLNTYIKEYGEDQEYEYIFGASGDGALMYADDAVNITEEVNGYVNNRYLGQQ